MLDFNSRYEAMLFAGVWVVLVAAFFVPKSIGVFLVFGAIGLACLYFFERA